MIAFENKATQMDDILDKMASEIQLDQTRYERMNTSYEAIKEWIESDDEFFKPYKYDIYPHGSVRIMTTVKPIKKEEFDLDIAVHLNYNTPHSPQEIYNQLKRRLNAHQKYKELLEPKNRCLRINYAGDFHIDILPGVQESLIDANKIKVPDRQLGSWVSSNPKGYASWFLGKANLVKESLLEKAMRAEKLPIESFQNKKPLQRAVQLIKRYRDIYFQQDDTYKTSSIILTTIAGQFYSGEESIFATINGIISSINTKIVLSPRFRLKVINPVNPNEDFTDKWENEPKYYEEFKKFVIHLNNEWHKLSGNQGVVNESIILKGLFGEDLFRKAQTNQATQVEELRKASNLATNRTSGGLTTLKPAGVGIIKHNTFFGDNEE